MQDVLSQLEVMILVDGNTEHVHMLNQQNAYMYLKYLKTCGMCLFYLLKVYLLNFRKKIGKYASNMELWILRKKYLISV